MYKMAFCNLRCRRLFICLPLMVVLCSTTGGRDHNSSPSPSEHQRMVALNKASERFLALIFEDYSDNSTRRISASRFNDILKELNLGEVTSAEDKPNENHTHEHRPVKRPSLQNSRRKGPSNDAQNSQDFQDREQRKVHENRHEQRKQRVSTKQFYYSYCLKSLLILSLYYDYGFIKTTGKFSGFWFVFSPSDRSVNPINKNVPVLSCGDVDPNTGYCQLPL